MMQANSKRIAKNTIILYLRMVFLMAISLYTSRVILEALGVEDFGLYNVVGGFVALFAVLSQSMSSAASRFLNYEMGIGDMKRLKDVFSTTLSIHIFLAIVIAIIAEIVGVWFVNERMVVPEGRTMAVNWVFQFSVITFSVNLATVPYNAAIIAHERMSTFAYISIFEGVSKLLICYLVMISPVDRLVFYAFLMLIVLLISRLAFYVYCKKMFEECTYYYVYDKKLIKSISGFASWNMIGSSSAILRDQGGNVLLNLFGGPVINAARAISMQVLHAVNGFVENFMMALKPQITQSYASGNRDYMMTLIFQGSRLSYYMLLVICMPILLNTEYLLHLWLKTVPNHTVLFVQLILIFTMIESISSPLITAQQATGKIRNYQIVVGGLQMMNIPVSYVVLKNGANPESILYVAIVFSVLCLIARLYMLRYSIGLDSWSFFVRVIINVICVTVLSIMLSLSILFLFDNPLLRFIIGTIESVVCSLLMIFYVGCKRTERALVYSKVIQIINKL